jgi:hypothetical protein
VILERFNGTLPYTTDRLEALGRRAGRNASRSRLAERKVAERLADQRAPIKSVGSPKTRIELQLTEVRVEAQKYQPEPYPAHCLKRSQDLMEGRMSYEARYNGSPCLFRRTSGHTNRRFLAQICRDVFRLGGAQVVGAVITIAILVFQLHYGIIPPSATMASLKSIALPYAVLVLLLVLLSTLTAGVKLDNERIQQLSAFKQARQAAEAELERLHSESVGPIVSPIERIRRESVKHQIDEYSEDEKSVLRYLLQNGQMEPIRLAPSCGLAPEIVSSAIAKATAHHLVVTLRAPRQGYPHELAINSELSEALRYQLFGE